MDMDHDRLMMVRAELSDMLAALQLTSFDANPVQFLIRLEAIREASLQYGFTAVTEIASVFEAAMQRVLDGRGADSVIDNFTGIMSDAIGCSQLSPGVAQSLLASISTRLPH